MQDLSGLRSLEGFRSLAGSTSMAMKAANPKPSSDAGGSSYGGFGNIKIATEKLAKEQAPVKVGLEIAHTKLRRATEQKDLLEGKLQQAVNENAKLKVKQNEDSKLWQQRKIQRKNLRKNSDNLDEFNRLLHNLSTKLECAEQKIISDSGKQEMMQIKQEKEEMDRSYKEQLYSNDVIEKENMDRERPLVNRDTEMLHIILRRATEQINLLEGKLQQAVNKNAKLTFGENLSVTFEQQACNRETERDEDEKKFFYEILGKNSTCLDEFQFLLHDLSTILEYEKNSDSLIKKLASVDENKASLICLDSLLCMNPYLKLKDDVVFGLKEILESTGCGKYNLELSSQCCSLEFKKLAVRKSATTTEWQLNEVKKKYDLMAEGNQIELQKYLKEISLKNGQVITGICKYFGLEKTQITNAENQKSVKDWWNEKISILMSCSQHFEKEHGTMVSRIHQDKEHIESTLWAYHKEELQRIHSHAENDLRKEYSVSSIERGHSYGRKEHELQLVTSNMRSIHSTPYISNSIKNKASWFKKKKRNKEPSDQNYPGNTATVILNRYDLKATQHSFKIAIRKARAWCRANSKVFDLSAHFGPGAEVFTTPADGTFHFTFEYDKRRLTLFLYGPNLYMMGWDGDRYGMFEIEKNFIPDKTCRYLDTGLNYHDYCPGGKVGMVRIGPDALIEKFDVLHKCNGVVTADVLRSIAVFIVGSSEPIRLEDVFEEYLFSFDTRKNYLRTLDGRSPLSSSVRKYGHRSKLLLKCLHQILGGDPCREIMDPREGRVVSVHELRHKIRVPLLDSFDEGDFKHDKPKKPTWSAPYQDGKDWSDTVLEEEEDIKYWPHEKDEELKDSECEDNMEQEEDDIKVRKADMNPLPAVRGSILRFSTAIASSGSDCIGKPGLVEGLCSGGLNGVNLYQSCATAFGRTTGFEIKQNTFWRPQGLSGWRKVQMATRFLKKFL
ncbi:hypothetical protein PVAP13_1NG365900 [Panicum virgatum]|uniref:rRNA N-glycosidase n=1 Tax=Panicum virgatum TaxID=38727 RepID=A0A8T0X0N8_PANVG|nr:hypothetical protein PVAP13_1NG365900 [Panicum virgatum]